MDDNDRDGDSTAKEQAYVRGGKGRRDEVGHTGIYPASAPDAPADAVVRGQEEFGHLSPRGEALVEVPKQTEE